MGRAGLLPPGVQRGQAGCCLETLKIDICHFSVWLSLYSSYEVSLLQVLVAALLCFCCRGCPVCRHSQPRLLQASITEPGGVRFPPGDTRTASHAEPWASSWARQSQACSRLHLSSSSICNQLQSRVVKLRSCSFTVSCSALSSLEQRAWASATSSSLFLSDSGKLSQVLEGWDIS